MKKTYFKLQRFAEGGDSGSEAAACETAVSETAGAETAADSAAATVKPTDAACEEMPDSDIQRIAAALNIDGGSNAVLESINGAKLRRSLERIFKERSAARAYEGLISEAEQLSEKVSGFSIEKELENRKFAAMLHSGLSVEEAWRAAHVDELLAATAQYAREEAERNMLSKLKNTAERPAENGAVGQAAARSRTSAENLTGKGIREILSRVENGARIKF